ncbi:MAG: hypothetical protein WBA20_02515 [Ketobacter sp.]
MSTSLQRYIQDNRPTTNPVDTQKLSVDLSASKTLTSKQQLINGLLMRLILSTLCAISFVVAAVIWWGRGALPTAATKSEQPIAIQRQPGAADEQVVTSEPVNALAAANKPPPSIKHMAKTDGANDADEADSIAALNEDYPDLDMRLHEMNGRSAGKTYDPEEVKQVLFEESAWEASDKPGDELALSDEEIGDGREFIQFKRLKLDSLVAGDQLDIPINQTGKTYQAEITQAVVNSDGSVTWNGQLMDELGDVSSESGSPYSVTITSGQAIVSGGIFTPEGHFVIEAVGEQGWIANASTLFKFDENKPDYVIPETH